MHASQSGDQGPHPVLHGTQFVKIHGVTGDWIVIPEPSPNLELTSEHLDWLCDRTQGVGAVGVVTIRQISQAAGHETTYRLESWDALGSPNETHSEAARAATAALAALNKITPNETNHYVFETPSGIITSVYAPTYIGIDHGHWSYIAPETATAIGSDVLVMAAGLTDPRPGLSIHLEHNHVTIAVESLAELEHIDLSQPPSIEPTEDERASTSFIVPKDPLIVEGFGRLALRHHHSSDTQTHLATAAATATVSFQNWSGLHQLNSWEVSTPHGNIMVQVHDHQRISTFFTMQPVFFGRL